MPYLLHQTNQSNQTNQSLNPLSFLNPVNAVTGIAQIGLGIGNMVNNNRINQQNLQLQQEQLEYQKQLQQDIFAREDTAYQRTVNDMRSAGLSPLSMNGTNGAGSVVSTSAPQRQTQSSTDAINGLNNAFNSFATAQQTLSSIQNAQKQNQLLQTQIDGNNIDNASRRLRNLAELKNIISQTNLRNKDIASFDVLLDDTLLNSLSLRNLRASESDLRVSETNLNKSLKTREDDYNALNSFRKNILENQSNISNYELQSFLSKLKRQIRDDNFMSTFGLTDSMPDKYKDLGIIFSDDDLFNYDNPLVKKKNNSEFKSIREYMRAGKSLDVFKESADLDTFGEWLLNLFFGK